MRIDVGLYAMGAQSQHVLENKKTSHDEIFWWSIVKQVRQAVYDSSAQELYLYKFIVDEHRHEFNAARKH